jgi:hypothetical protein
VEFTRALQETRRPHIFVWGQNGHGERAYFPTADGGGDNPRGPLGIRLDRSLPAFTRCSLDDDFGDGDPSHGAPSGQVNLYLRWGATPTDEKSRYAIDVYLIGAASAGEATTNMTLRRTQAFRPKPGEKLAWTSKSAKENREVQQGECVADPHGLVTIEGLKVSKDPRLVEILAAP